MDIKHISKDHASQNIPLNYEEAYALGQYALKGCDGDALAQIQSIAMLSALHNKATYAWQWAREGRHVHNGHSLPPNAAEQIAGVCAAIFDLDIGESEFGFANPGVPYVMDNCGMGGDLIVTANVSTLAALIAATAGIPMCKHGSPANADGGRHGSSDFISETLGLDQYPRKDILEQCIEAESFGYIEALDVRYKRIHIQTHEVAKLPHMNDIVGPITSPVNPQLLARRVLGLNQLVPPVIAAEAYRILNQRGITNLRHGLFVRGFADERHLKGIDEVSICPGGTQVAELCGNDIREFALTAEDFGISAVPVASISPPENMSKGDFSLSILHQEIGGAPLQMVLANASLLFVLAGHAVDYRDGYRIAGEVFESGGVVATVARLKRIIPARAVVVG
jgi:anthranilate phosphoribosyltransferase